MKTMPVKIVCVINNYEIFNKTIVTNAHMSDLPIHVYDNTVENIPISQRYNHYIKNYMQNEDWLIFCHQDFGFLEDPRKKLQALDAKCIYGPIGAARKKGIFIRNSRVLFEQKKLYGQINQARNDERYYQNGIYLNKPKRVDTIDCCCMIVHASLINQYSLSFDETFQFHLYIEDFTLRAQYSFGVKTKAVQIKCKHSSIGRLNEDFHKSLENLKLKYIDKKFVGTCFS